MWELFVSPISVTQIIEITKIVLGFGSLGVEEAIRCSETNQQYRCDRAPLRQYFHSLSKSLRQVFGAIALRLHPHEQSPIAMHVFRFN